MGAFKGCAVGNVELSEGGGGRGGDGSVDLLPPPPPPPLIHIQHGLLLFKNFSGWFLRAFAKLWKAPISFVMSVRPSIRSPSRAEQLGYHWTDFREI
jgi:hypothetical protein